MMSLSDSRTGGYVGTTGHPTDVSSLIDISPQVDDPAATKASNRPGQPQEQAPQEQARQDFPRDYVPTKKVYPPNTVWKFLPLVIFALIVAVITAVGLILTRPTNCEPPTSAEDDDGIETDAAKRCLQQLRYNFLGVEAVRLDPGAPQLMATEWMAFEDSACSVDLDFTLLEQRYALLTLYFAMGGVNWGFYGWASPGVHECEWERVDCNTNDQVAKLELINATGSLVDEIGLLSSLTSLDLAENWIEGTIPAALYSVTNLVFLDLSFNQIAGSLDTAIGKLTRLEHFGLANNLFSGTLPESLRSLERLKDFDIRGNSFEGNVWSFIPSWQDLEFFTIARNSVGGTIPTEISNLTGLVELDLDKTLTVGTIPTEIGHLTSLLLFRASDVPLMIGTSIPTGIGLCTSLEILRLDQSGFSGPIPSEVGMLAELKELTATLNRLTGTVPEDLGQLSNLVLFELKSNHNMSGTFPSTLCEIGGTELINKCFPDCSCCGDCAGG